MQLISPLELMRSKQNWFSIGYRGRLPTISYSLLLRTISSCGEILSGGHSFIGALAEVKVNTVWRNRGWGGGEKTAKGKNIARARQLLSLVSTKHHRATPKHDTDGQYGSKEPGGAAAGQPGENSEIRTSQLPRDEGGVGECRATKPTTTT